VITSLWSRIVFAQVAAALLLALGLPLVIDRTIHGIGDDLTRRFLSGEADRAIADGLIDRPASQAAIGATGAIAIYMVSGGDARRLAGPTIPDIRDASAARMAQRAFLHGTYSDFLARPLSRGRLLLVAEDRRHPAVLLDDITTRFIRRFAVIVPIALVFSTLASLIAVHRAMRPLAKAAAQARSIDLIRPGAARLATAGIPAEVEPLVHATNELIERAIAGYARERVFSATVVHELRTALSTISLRAELLPASASRDKVVDAVDRANRVVTQMLELHGKHGELVTGKPVAVSVTASELLEQLQILSDRCGRRIQQINLGSQSRCLAPQSLVETTLQNVVENAMRHSIPGSDILIVCDDDHARITVADAGPGIRMREGSDGRRVYSRADGISSGSSGLGIAIVTRLIESAGGSISFGRSDLGGTAVTLNYPDVTAA